MNNFFKRLTNSGTTAIEDPDIIQRVRQANIGILTLFFSFLLVGLPISYSVPELTPLTLIALLAFVASFFIIIAGNHLAGRLFFVCSLFIVLLLSHSAAVKSGESPLAAFCITIISSWILPWHLFSFRKERFALFNALLVGVLSLLLIPFSAEWIEPDFDNSFLKSAELFVAIAITVGVTNVLRSLSSARAEAAEARKKEQVIQELEKQKTLFEQTNQELRNSLASLEGLQASEELRKKSIMYQAELSDVLRAHSNNLEMACDRAIALITRYIEANAGAIFLHEEAAGQQYLEMVACYANGKRKYISKKFGIAEGVVGQVFMEKAHIIANNVPEEHIQISSGLGQHPPTHLLLVPMMQNDIVTGVMEFASFRPFEPLIVEMAEKLANVTASIIITTRINQRTRELLEQSQQQTEDLRAREEEMRQNMEELAATQEEMARINDELSNKSIAVNILLGVIEIGLDKRILSVNDNFAEFVGYTKEELLQMTHTDLIPFDVYQKQDYELWWESLVEGKIFNGKSIRKTKSGKNITLNCCYRPVFSPVSKEVVRITKYCYPVTMQF